MQTDSEFGPRAQRLERLMHVHLGLSKGDLVQRTKRARKRLPKSVKTDILKVAEAAHLVQNPRIAPQINRREVSAAYKRAYRHLHGPEIVRQREKRLIGAAASLVVNLSLVFVLVLAVLLWQDFV